LGKLASKKLSTNILVASIVNLWKNREETLPEGSEAKDQLFTLLRQVIKAGDKAYLISESRLLLQLFLEAWDEREVSEIVIEK
jgi:hypothetical protein